MNKSKQTDIVRKRNAELTKQLKDLEFKLEFNSQLNTESHKRAKDLIADLERIKQEWLLALDDLNNKREKYDDLIVYLQEMKKIMSSVGIKIPWYKKIIIKFKNI